MNIISILLPPILGAIIALSTNWIAIKMLFRPHKEVRIFGIRMPFTPGLIPKERGRLARKLGEAISKHLLTPDILADKLADPSIWPLPDYTIGQLLINQGIDDPAAYIESKISDPIKKAADAALPKAIGGIAAFPEKFPALDAKLAELTNKVAEKSISRLATLFVNRDKIYTNIKEGIFSYLLDPDNQDAIKDGIHNAIDNILAGSKSESIKTMLAPILKGHEDQSLCQRICEIHIKDGVEMLFKKEPYAGIIRRGFTVAAGYMATHMPIADMIEEKMGGIDVANTEKLILSVVGRELKLIIVLGGLFGFLIGLLSLAMQFAS